MIAEQLLPLATSIKKLKLMPGNPRKGDVDAVARSYEKFGQRKAIVAKRDGTVIDGNHQLLAAKKLGWTEIAVVFTDDDDLTAKAYALAANRTSDLGTYDNAVLQNLLVEVSKKAELLLATGFSRDDLADLDALVEEESAKFKQLKDNYSPTQDRVEQGVKYETSMADLADAYEHASVRSVILDFNLDVFEFVVECLNKLRSKYEVKTNSEAVERFFREADL